MLSQEQVKACYRRKEWPLLDTPVNVRVKFQKIGDLQYISHLDLQRTLHRILVRAGIPMWYTKGFNPHAKIVFSTPLSVGAQSICEMVDIRIDRDMPCETIKELLNHEVTDELRILDVYIAETKFADIAWATYEIELHEDGIAKKAAEILAIAKENQLLTTKKTKSGEKEIDILPLIRELSVATGEDCDSVRLTAMLSLGSDNYLNPELLLSVVKQKVGILSAEDSWYSIVRTATYTADGVTEFR